MLEKGLATASTWSPSFTESNRSPGEWSLRNRPHAGVAGPDDSNERVYREPRAREMGKDWHREPSTGSYRRVRRFGTLRPLQIWVISVLTFLLVGMEAVTSALAMDHVRVQPDP